MNKVLTICPSRNRPRRLTEMLDSFNKTNSFSDILVYVSDDDPKIEEYKSLKAPIMFGRRRTIVEVFNHIFNVCPNYEFYSEINDDHVYHTDGWDSLLTSPIKDYGISCGGSEGLPSGIVISGNIPRALGYLVTPLLQHTYVDNYFETLGKELGRYYRVPEVFIEHKHWLYGKAEKDENYEWVTSQKTLDYGKEAFKQWELLHKKSDLEKIENACRGVD